MSMRLGVVRDYPEENWPSMDLVADMLLKYSRKAGDVSAESLVSGRGSALPPCNNRET